MSDASDGGEKTFDPTEKRLEDERQKGNVVKSADISVAAGYLGLLLALILFGPGIVNDFGNSLTGSLARADDLSSKLTSVGGSKIGFQLFSELGIRVLPLFALPFALVLASIFAQNGFAISTSKLMAKSSRISPITNAKNKFGRSGLFEFAKSLTKLVVVSVLVAAFVRLNFESLLGSAAATPPAVAVMIASNVTDLLWLAFLIALVISVFDYLWQRFDHSRKLMMSRQEILDETKNSEGDPHLKQERRRRGYDIATQRMLADVPKADVIIVNPQHYAVALVWNRDALGAPVVVAKGTDEVAAIIRQIAANSAVPIRRDPPTARAIFATVEIGQEVLQEHFKPVAAAIRYAEKIRAMATKRSGR